MAAELYASGNAAFVDDDYEQAVKLYNDAIELEQENDEYYSSRAQAFIKLDKYKEALEDAQKASQLNPKNAKSFLRKGICHFNLKDYLAAQKALSSAKDLDESNSLVNTWLRKCEDVLKTQETEISEKWGERLQMSESDIYSCQILTTKVDTCATDTLNPSISDSGDMEKSKPPTDHVPMPTGPKTRYDWYQTEKYVVITILIKNLKKEDVTTNIQEKELSVTVKLPTGSDYTLELDLAQVIVPNESIFKILSTKVEIKLKKRDGLHWTKLEGEDDHVKQIPVESSKVTTTNKYPSSKQNTTNWDELVAEIKEEEKGEKLEGDAALNNLFQQIYSDGNDEVRKAMNKSFTESGGTVLSTNWGEVGEKKVDIKPPDGMEYKNY